MSATPEQLPTEADPERIHQGIQKIAGLGLQAINLAVVAWCWGNWPTIMGFVALAVVLTLTNLLFIEWYARRYSRLGAEWLRTLANGIGLCLGGSLTDWTPLIWAFLPYNMLWLYGLDRSLHLRLTLYVGLVVAYALWDGAPRELAVVFTLLSALSYQLTARRDLLLRQVLRQVVAQREQLAQVHERALAQEKLSSLGVMAAGVAHEINNPMSFVTSNVNSLYKDLRRQPSLPEPLREYVDEVLPETLDGIKRVNAIVADLRRFARGDPEAYAEYDLNAEAQTALRIAHGQLSHCQVEVELGEPGTLVGRAGQIVQVLVNLLTNAGHATSSGARVRLSTHGESDGARVEIRDAGTGMPPEVLRNLFQPFFTTKPLGEGTGLGLAVAHGIISSHGGRIEVTSQPGQGTCFTVHLPRVPPMPAYRKPAELTER